MVFRVKITESSARPPTKSRTMFREFSYTDVLICEAYPAPR